MIEPGSLSYTLPLRYLASIHVDAGSLVATPQSLAEAGALFSEVGLIPSPNDQYVLQPIQQPSAQIQIERNRIHLLSIDGSLQIMLGRSRFDYMIRPIDGKASNMPSFEQFCLDATVALSRLSTHYRRIPHRLAATQEGLVSLHSIGHSERIPGRIFKMPKSFTDQSVIEWDWRIAATETRKISSNEELTNNIFIMKRLPQLQIALEDQKTIPFDGFQLDLDINTSGVNTALRFGEDHIRDFFVQAPQWHRQLRSELWERIQ